ncbi:hypothetical protein HXA35_17435 [Bacillus sp. A301a_S52]|nr:hypothetical protein [Bacillus sp. A301a_S52]
MLFFVRLYKCMMTSLLFWYFLFRGMVVYSLLPSSYALVKTTADITLKQDITKEGDDIPIGDLFKAYYSAYAHLKLPSFMFTNIFLVLFACLYFINLEEGTTALLLTIVLLYLFSLSFMMFTYTIHLLGHNQMNFSHVLIYAFTSCIKNIGISVSLIAILAIFYYIGTVNFILFLVSFPCSYAFTMKALLTNVTIGKAPVNT